MVWLFTKKKKKSKNSKRSESELVSALLEAKDITIAGIREKAYKYQDKIATVGRAILETSNYDSKKLKKTLKKIFPDLDLAVYPFIYYLYCKYTKQDERFVKEFENRMEYHTEFRKGANFLFYLYKKRVDFMKKHPAVQSVEAVIFVEKFMNKDKSASQKKE